ncbi:MAG TPA: hypothetical protein VE868_07000 [Balneolaceae bacterium]|nr:hypothetical protein [Balneolaceae bacterium]
MIFSRNASGDVAAIPAEGRALHHLEIEYSGSGGSGKTSAKAKAG